MIYLVSLQTELFNNDIYERMSIEEALQEVNSWDIIQVDSETTGRDPHICDILCFQFGNDKADKQIVLDCKSYPITLFKEILESRLLIGQNLKFDLQFLYKYKIVPLKVYDTMIVEQLLYLGYPPAGKPGGISYSLKSIAERRLGIDIDKTVRGEIIWRGLDASVVKYAAYDVFYLEKIRDLQLKDCEEKGCLVGADLENLFVPAISYMEWSGIMLDVDKWSQKMKSDKENLEESIKKLNSFVTSNLLLKEFTKVELQGSLFDGFNTDPICTINWSSSKQVIQVAKILGFNTTVKDKKTGESTDSVIEKALSVQKGINDEFLKLYFDYQEYAKVVSSFGQGHLNAINPLTGRIHTTFKQLGASSGRLSCGSTQSNEDLAKLKKLKLSDCKYPNLQQLPHDKITRAAFVAPKGYKFASADFSSEESRLAADIYQDKEFYKEFTERSGDTHSMFAWAVFRKECEECGCKGVADVKKMAPQWRSKVKAVEFAYLFGAAAPTISNSAGCTVEEAQAYIDTLNKEFSGVSSFAKQGAKFVRENGYILINPITGNKLYWHDWKNWKKEEEEFKQEGFWEDYKLNHKGTQDSIASKVRRHFQAAGKYDRLARNVVTQGTGACILKLAMSGLFKWIVKNNYFDKIHICCAVHDEICCDYPEEVTEFPKILTTFMEKAAEKFCKSLPIPAEVEVSDHWIH